MKDMTYTATASATKVIDGNPNRRYLLVTLPTDLVANFTVGGETADLTMSTGLPLVAAGHTYEWKDPGLVPKGAISIIGSNAPVTIMEG